MLKKRKKPFAIFSPIRAVFHPFRANFRPNRFSQNTICVWQWLRMACLHHPTISYPELSNALKQDFRPQAEIQPDH